MRNKVKRVMDLIHEIQDEELYDRQCCIEFLEELEYAIEHEIEEGRWSEEFEDE